MNSYSKRWKLLIQSRGRSFIFSTAAPVPVVAAAHGELQSFTWIDILKRLMHLLLIPISRYLLLALVLHIYFYPYMV